MTTFVIAATAFAAGWGSGIIFVVLLVEVRIRQRPRKRKKVRDLLAECEWFESADCIYRGDER